MRLVCFSDTHKQHKMVTIPDGDCLIFAGDMCGCGGSKSARRFAEWMHLQPHKYKIVIAGNHDHCFEKEERLLVRSYVRDLGLTYLEHETIIIEGITFFGSPYTPYFRNWAFNIRQYDNLERKWSQIPDDTQVLITHGPPFEILDKNIYGQNCGCAALLNRVNVLANLKDHIFGHIHHGYGKIETDKVFVNCCICDEEYKPTNQPIVVEI